MVSLLRHRTGFLLAAGGFSPASIPGLVLWLDSSRPGSVFADTDPISTWTDLSGRGNHATRSGATRPLYRLAVRPNGKGAVRFNGTSQYLDNAYTGEPNTVFVVGRNGNTGHRTWMGAKSLAAVNIDAYYFKANEPAGLLSFARATSADTTGAGDFNASSGRAPLDTWYAQAGRINGTTIDSWANGIKVATDTTAGTLRSLDGPASIGAGYYADALGDYLDGDIGLILVYSGALTDAQIAQLFRWSKAGWWTAPTLQTYLFATFVDASASFRLYTSAAGLTWTAVDCSYVPSTGFVRDISIMKRSGTYWFAHTNVLSASVACTSFSVAKTSDLIWAEPVTAVSMAAISGVNRVWAPEWFVDPVDDSVHVFVACSTDAGTTFAIYETHPTDAAMTTWSAPVAVTGSGLPTVMIDPFVVKRGSTYYLWYKANNTTELICYASSSSLTSGYTVTQTGDWAGWGVDLEGAALLSLGGSSWRIYMDKYAGSNQGMYYSDSADNWATWSAKALVTPSTLRHGTVVPA